MKIETVEIDKLRPFERNPKRHPETQLKKLRKSISEFGWTNPILATKDGMIVAGHARLEAAKQLNINEVPVIYLDMPYEKAIAYVIADNRLAELAETDTGLLSELLGELSALPDFDVELTGFSLDEIALLNPMEVIEDDFDVDKALEEIDEPVTKLGDVILLGRHRLLCGNSIDEKCVARLMNGKKADMCYTDPPYGVSIVRKGTIGGDKPFGKGKNGFDGVIKAGEYSPIIGDDTINTALSAYEICTQLKINPIILWGGNYYAHKLPPTSCWIIWDKETDGKFGDGEVAYCNAKKSIRIFRHKWSGMIKASERGEKRVHPTQKPIALAVWAFNEFGKENNNVLDLFLGSGSTLIAAEQTNRICFGCEISELYCDVIIGRYINFKNNDGDVFLLLENGDKQPWVKVKEERRSSVKTATKNTTQ